MHLPLAQTPLQHCVELWQPSPPTKHPPPQKAATQLSQQHSEAPPHGAPGSTHWTPPQKPPPQFPSQHSAAVVQAAPCAVHAGWPQVPLHTPWQHSAALEQAVPSGLHAGAPQTPAVQSDPQQSVDVVQAWPSGAQTGVAAHTLPVPQVRPSQQAAPATLQEVPTGEQGLPAWTSSWSRAPHAANELAGTRARKKTSRCRFMAAC